MRLECADVLLPGVQPVDSSKGPWEGAALQQPKAELKEEGGKLLEKAYLAWWTIRMVHPIHSAIQTSL